MRRAGVGAVPRRTVARPDARVAERKEQLRVRPVEMRSLWHLEFVSHALCARNARKGAHAEDGTGVATRWSTRRWRRARAAVSRPAGGGGSRGLGDGGVGDSVVDVVGVGGEFELLDFGLSITGEREQHGSGGGGGDSGFFGEGRGEDVDGEGASKLRGYTRVERKRWKGKGCRKVWERRGYHREAESAACPARPSRERKDNRRTMTIRIADNAAPLNLVSNKDRVDPMTRRRPSR
jgi:hypothetical protein